MRRVSGTSGLVSQIETEFASSCKLQCSIFSLIYKKTQHIQRVSHFHHDYIFQFFYNPPLLENLELCFTFGLLEKPPHLKCFFFIIWFYLFYNLPLPETLHILSRVCTIPNQI